MSASDLPASGQDVSDLPPFKSSSMMTLLERQVADADAAATAALDDATTAEGFWTASASRSMAFDLAARLMKVQKVSAETDIELLLKAAELDLKRAEVKEKYTTILNEQAKANVEIAKGQQEVRKLQAEAREIEIRNENSITQIY